MDYQTAKEQLILGHSTEWFGENGFLLEDAYSLVLSGDAQKAFEKLNTLCDSDVRADWLKRIIPLFLNKPVNEYPSFLQVRNFLELDLDMLIKSDNKEYVIRLLNNAEMFYSICRESFKFIGRALYYNSKNELALEFFLKAKDNFYNDAELHYLLAKMYEQQGDKEKCRHAVKECLRLIPDYEPALKMLENNV